MNFLLSKNIPRYQDNQDHRDGKSAEGDSKKDDPELLKPIHAEREDLGASTNFKERKLGILGKSTLGLAGLMFLASPLLAIALIVPILYQRFFSKQPNEPAKNIEHDLDIERRQERIDQLKSAIDNAQSEENFLDPKSPIPLKSVQPPKPILKKSPRKPEGDLGGDLDDVVRGLSTPSSPPPAEPSKQERKVRFGPDIVTKF